MEFVASFPNQTLLQTAVQLLCGVAAKTELRINSWGVQCVAVDEKLGMVAHVQLLASTACDTYQFPETNGEAVITVPAKEFAQLLLCADDDDVVTLRCDLPRPSTLQIIRRDMLDNHITEARLQLTYPVDPFRTEFGSFVPWVEGTVSGLKFAHAMQLYASLNEKVEISLGDYEMTFYASGVKSDVTMRIQLTSRCEQQSRVWTYNTRALASISKILSRESNLRVLMDIEGRLCLNCFRLETGIIMDVFITR